MKETIIIKSKPLQFKFFAKVFLKNYITVTSIRIYGITITGKVFDMPLCNIKAMGNSCLKGLTVFTAQGRLHFKFIANNTEIPETVSRYMINMRDII